MTPAELSDYLRNGEDLYLTCRRGIVVSSFLAAGCMMLIGLFQTGLISGLAEPPWKRFRAEEVDAAAFAYSPMGLPMPDAFLGLVSYSVTAALAVFGGMDRPARLWWVVLLLAVKVLIDAVQAGRLSWQQWADHRAFCFWCLVAALATFVSLGLAVPETAATIRRLTSR